MDISTDREVRGSAHLTLIEAGVESQTFEGEHDTLLWRRYEVDIADAVMDTGQGNETLRLTLHIRATEPPLHNPLWIEHLEISITGLRSGMEISNSALDLLRVVFYEVHGRSLVRRVWRWQRGQPPLGNIRLWFQLVRRSHTLPRWTLNIRLWLEPPSGPPHPRRRLHLHSTLTLAPA
ncbi:MAG: hypothetical protein NZ473_01210 [Candidatus Kapabacteria bacterium]|nr:hypothetical protein [Candidatus Kapabacteria bacterium]